MQVEKLITKDGIVAGRIEKLDGCRFLILTGASPVFLNGKELKMTNRFGKVRPYMLGKQDELKW